MGFSEGEMRSAFLGHITQLSEQKFLLATTIIGEMREWYNGYQFADDTSDFLSLRIPNKEVRQSLMSDLLASYAKKDSAAMNRLGNTLRSGLANRDLDVFFEGFNTILPDISYHLHIPQERFYHALLQMCLMSLGFSVETEVETSRGRIDLVLHLLDALFIFELKIDQPAVSALKLIKEAGYLEKYRLQDKPIYLVGVRCSSHLRSVEEWKQEALKEAGF